MIDFIVYWSVWLICLFVLTFLHELGHVIMYRLTGGNANWKITLGWGKPILQIRRVTINAWFFYTGYVSGCFKNADRVYKKILRYAGGMLMNMLCLGLLGLFILLRGKGLVLSNINGDVGNQIIRAVFFINILMIVLNAIPIKCYAGRRTENGKTPNDGLLILQALRVCKAEKVHGGKQMEPPKSDVK